MELCIVSSDDKSSIEQCYAIHCDSQPNAWSEAVFYDQVSAPYQLIAAQKGSKILGYVNTLTVLDEITIMDIAVSEHVKRQGTAQALLKYVMQSAPVESMFLLEVREGNVPAIALYRKLGFEQIALRKEYYPGIGDPSRRESAIIMQTKTSSLTNV